MKKSRAASEKLEKTELLLASKTDEQKKALEELERLLAGKSLDKREAEEKELLKQKVAVEKLLDIGKEVSLASEKSGKLEKRCREIRNELLVDNKKQQELIQVTKEENAILTQLKEKQRLELLVAKYEHDRERLVAGDPCPLCGSLTHPWAEEGTPEAADSEKAFQNQENKIKKLREEYAQITAKISSLSTEEKQLFNVMKEEGEKCTELSEKWDALCTQFEYSQRPEEYLLFKETLADLKNYINASGCRIGEIKKTAELKNRLGDEIIKKEKEKSIISLDNQKADREKSSADKESKMLREEIDEVTKEISTAQTALNEILKEFGELVGESPDETLLKKLNERKTAFLKAKAEIEESEKLMVPLQEQRSFLIQDLKTKGERIREEGTILQEQEKELKALVSERKKLLGEDDPENALKHIKEQQDQLENRVKVADQQVSAIKSDLNTRRELLKNREEDFVSLDKETKTATLHFEKNMSEAGFDNLEGFKAALINRAEYTRLEELKNALETHVTEAKARLEDTKIKLKIEQERTCQVKTLDEIQEMIKGRELLLDELQRELGKIEEVLKNQERLRGEQKKLINKISSQKKEYSLWSNLNDLIGSADGKKFRRFAQGLTFDQLIQIANHHLGS